MTPQRIQRKRAKGWRAPEGAVYVGRGSKWGNPWRVTRQGNLWVIIDEGWLRGSLFTREVALRTVVAWYAEAVANGWNGVPGVEEARTELRGKTLMCWCPADQPCHADVLLELANMEGA